MEEIFYDNNGRRILIYDDKNTVVINYIHANKVVTYGVLCKDYHSELQCYSKDDRIFIAYITVENQLVWDELGKESRLVLFGDKDELWNMTRVRIIDYMKGNILFVKARNTTSGREEIRYVFLDGDRKGNVLVSTMKKIEWYEILVKDGDYYLIYKVEKQTISKIFIMSMSSFGDINIEEYIMCKSQTVELLKERIDTIEDTHKREVADIVEKYKKQYNELVDVTKQIQEEGKKWRDLYYKNVKEN